MIVKHTDRCANRSLTITPRIPRYRQTRGPVVLVAREPLLHAHRVLCGLNIRGRERNARQRIAQWKSWYLLSQLIVVTNTVVECQVGTHFPRILCEERHRLVADAADWISEALDKVGWEAE